MGNGERNRNTVCSFAIAFLVLQVKPRIEVGKVEQDYCFVQDNGSPINGGGAGSNHPLRGSKGSDFEGQLSSCLAR